MDASAIAVQRLGFFQNSAVIQPRPNLSPQDQRIRHVAARSMALASGSPKPSYNSAAYFVTADARNTLMNFPAVTSPVAGAQGAAIGLSTVNYVPSYFRAYESYGHRKEAQRKEDPYLADSHLVKIAANTSLAAAATAIAAARPLSMTLNLMTASGIKPSSSLLAASRGVSGVGNAFFLLFYFFQSVFSGRNIKEAYGWYTKLDSELSLAELLFSIPTVDDILNKLDQEAEGHKDMRYQGLAEATDLLEDAAYQQATFWLTGHLEEMKKEGMLKDVNFSSENIKSMAKDYLDKNEKGLAAGFEKTFGKELWSQCWEKTEGNILAAFGLAQKVSFAREAKEQEVLRVFGGDKELIAKLKNPTLPTAERLELAKTAIKWTIAKDAFYIFLYALGSAALVLGLFTKASLQAIGGILYGIYSVLWLPFDGKSFLDWMKTGQIGTFEKGVLYFSLALCTLSVVALVVTSCFFGGPLWMLVIGLITQLIWAGLVGAALVKAQNAPYTNPTLDSLRSLLRDPNVKLADAKIQEVVANLSAADKKVLDKKMHALEERNIDFENLNLRDKYIQALERIHADKRASLQKIYNDVF